MNMKQAASILMFVVCFTGYGMLLWSDPGSTEPRLVPFTWEIVHTIHNSTNPKEAFTVLKYYLSKPFSIEPEQNSASKKIEVNNGILRISGGPNISTGRIEFTTADPGTLRTIGTASESFVIIFKNIPLRFIKNSQGRYDLVSAEIDSETFALRPRPEGERLPQLYILITDTTTEINKRLEMRAVPNSELYNNQRRTNDQQFSYRDNSGQSYQPLNTGYSAGQFSGRPSKYIDGQSYVNTRGITAYVIRQNPSVNRETLNRLINTYREEAAIEGINLDIAIAQMLYATNFLASQQRMATHNYGGLSTQTPGWNGSFYNMTEGVRAHIQHLKGYASTRLNRPLVDPRYHILADLGYRGNIKTFEQLFGVWTAGSASYANSINDILGGLYWFSGNN